MSEVNQGGGEAEEAQQLELPPGFRFHPTDEEVVTHYLTRKALNCLFCCLVIADVDLNKIEPWDLPKKAKMGEKEWYFFCHKDRKYPTGLRTNRATETGYWKATGRDKEIFRGGVLVGMKKTLVFYLGRAPRGKKTTWVMHEFRLEGKLPANLPRAAKDEWAVCRVFNKDLAAKQPAQPPAVVLPADGLPRNDSFCLDDFFEMPPPLIDAPVPADDFKAGAGTSSSSGAMAAGMPIVGYQIKTEQQQNQNPAPPSLMPQAEPYNSYFSVPSTTNNSGGGGYSYQQAAAQDMSAIRRHCPDMASSRPAPLFPELDDLFSDGFLDYSNMWKPSS